MKRILLVQTAFAYHQIAYVEHGVVVQLWENEQSRQTLQFLMGSLSEVKAYPYEAIVFVQGPGSFTSLRVGATWVNALANIQNKPILPLSTFDYLALALGESMERRVVNFDTKHFFILENGVITDHAHCPEGAWLLSPDAQKIAITNTVASNIANHTYTKEVPMTDVLYIVAPKITFKN